MQDIYGLPAHLPEDMWPDAARLKAIELWAGEVPALPEFVIGSYKNLIAEIEHKGWGEAQKKRPKVSTPRGEPRAIYILTTYNEWDFNWIGWVKPGYAAGLLKNQPVFTEWDAIKAHGRINRWMIHEYEQAGFTLSDEDAVLRLHRA